jgi:hypothetical protein
LLKISDTCRENKLVCVFLTQPNAYQINTPQELKDRFWMTPVGASYTLTYESLVHIAEVYNRRLIEFATQRSHPFCDLAAQISPEPVYFFDDYHFTAAGSARVAGVLADCLEPILSRAGLRPGSSSSAALSTSP